ncbi:hypothetical protein DXG03_006886 [Asterophora parasitica]|uniref:F-box domain-containing protein n=1 Tax=Asterophora parasitica TaxID=117018 RepID=A0A9P7G2E3_9AGAR|nr:hypothetical protein DXG03_006886 [Asterophora parasitica]
MAARIIDDHAVIPAIPDEPPAQDSEEKLLTDPHASQSDCIEPPSLPLTMHLDNTLGSIVCDDDSPVGISRLPAEILLYIFSFHADEEIHSLVSTLLNISQVCRAWRNASLACASLWTSISIDANCHIGADWKLVVQMLPGIWFINAKHLPLSLSIKCPNPHYLSKIFSSGALDSLVPFFSQITKLHILSADLDGLVTFFHLPRGTLSSLESLRLGASPHEVWEITSTDVFSSVPLLRRVALDIPPTQIWLASEFVFPWSQLTHLELIQMLRIDHWVTIFSQCTQLQHGSFTMFSDFDFPIPIPLVAFKSLTNLKLISGSMVDLLERFTFPALRDLTIIALENFHKWPVNELLRSFPLHQLHSLTLRDVDIQLEALLEFLGECNALETLRLELPWLDDAFSRSSLRHSQSPPAALANLKSLEVCMSADSKYGYDASYNDIFISPDDLATLLRWWYESPSPLPRAVVHVYGLIGMNHLKKHRKKVDWPAVYLVEPVDIDRPGTFISGLRAMLNDCLFDKSTRPSGLVLETNAFTAEEYHLGAHPWTNSVFT